MYSNVDDYISNDKSMPNLIFFRRIFMVAEVTKEQHVCTPTVYVCIKATQDKGLRLRGSMQQEKCFAEPVAFKPGP